MSIFANDEVPVNKILACQSALEAATLINEHYHFSVGSGAGKSLHTFTPIERKLVSLILQAAQQKRAADGAEVCRVVNHVYIDGVCAQCGFPEPPRR